MTIDKAIEILERALKAPWVAPSKPRKEAISLGIEALKAIKLQREDLTLGCPVVLNGETKE